MTATDIEDLVKSGTEGILLTGLYSISSVFNSVNGLFTYFVVGSDFPPLGVVIAGYGRLQRPDVRRFVPRKITSAVGECVHTLRGAVPSIQEERVIVIVMLGTG